MRKGLSEIHGRFFILIFLFSLLLIMPIKAFVERVGIPRLDGIAAEVETDLDNATTRFLAGEFDFLSGISRFDNVEALQFAGHTTIGTPDFYLCYIAFNTRDYVPDDYEQPDAGRSLYPQNLTSWRLALAWAGFSEQQKEQTLAEVFGAGFASAAVSVVPEQLGVWHNMEVPDVGGNYTKAWEILQADGFFISGNILYAPNNVEVRDIALQSLVGLIYLMELAQRWVDQWNDFMDNFLNVTNCNFTHEPHASSLWFTELFDYRNFDMYLYLWGLDRFPDYLYDFFHSSQDGPGRFNSPGIKDAQLDNYIETIIEGLDFTEKIQASHDAQIRLLETMPYLYAYHGIIWDGIRGTAPKALENWVKMGGIGVDNTWTWRHMHWANKSTGGTVNYVRKDDFYDNLHPGWADSSFEIWLMNRIQSPLIETTPSKRDMPWIALNWSVEPFSNPSLGIDIGIKITFRIRDDLYWQDGFPITVEDIKFSWEFMQNFPNFYSTYQYLLWVEILDPHTIAAYLDTTSQFKLYDFTNLALYWPKHIYDPALHPTKYTTNDPVWEIDWNSWMADYTGTIPDTAGFNYTALVGAGQYVFAGSNQILEIVNLTKNVEPHDFFDDSPIEGIINVVGRAEPNTPCGYSVLVINAGSRNNETGEFNACVIDSFTVKINGIVDNVQTVTYQLEQFDYVEFGPYQTTLPSGAHNLTVEVFEAGVADPIDISTTTVFATVREDLNYDIYVGIDDIITVAEAFGSSPLIYHDIRDPRWDPRCDFNNDDYVGIDDIVSASEAFGTP